MLLLPALIRAGISAGEPCPCGTWVTPAFHFTSSHLDCQILTHVQEDVKVDQVCQALEVVRLGHASEATETSSASKILVPSAASSPPLYPSSAESAPETSGTSDPLSPLLEVAAINVPLPTDPSVADT
ncbi:unnamed protein product [Protopolystoma xenopodis]|uniref:Uncharacterized protein n=1 Tax=Protopolystoma xenopodis TaxID=117903 RepID=A0A448XCH1_9PLAT|nr:unnamed protein product [Protopolystoma xenopodis]